MRMIFFALLALGLPQIVLATPQEDICHIEGTVASVARWDRFPANGSSMSRVRFNLSDFRVRPAQFTDEEWCREVFKHRAEANNGLVQVTINNPKADYNVPPMGTCAVFRYRFLEGDSFRGEGFSDLDETCASGPAEKR